MFLVKSTLDHSQAISEQLRDYDWVSPVTHFSVIYSSENMRLSAVPSSQNPSQHNKSLSGFSEEHVHAAACWLRNCVPHLDLSLQIKSQKNICRWALGIWVDPKYFAFL
jgi:hypothetical protein